MGFDLGLSEIGAIASLAGTAVSAVGQLGAANAAGQAASYQAQVAKNNEQIAAQNARYAAAAGAEAATAQSLQARAATARLKTGAAAMGLDVNSGSPLDVQVSEREVGELDTETKLNNALLQAYGYRAQGTNFEAQSRLYEMQAKQAPLAGLFSAGGTLLSNVSSLPFKFGGSTFGGSSLDLTNTGGTWYGQVPPSFVMP